MNTITLQAHAKINPSLDVLARRDDGYHEVRLIMQLIELHDFVILTWQEESPGPAAQAESPDQTAQADASPLRIQLTCDDPQIPCDASNLAWKAAEAVAAAMQEAGKPAPFGELTIHIEKHIPMAAGLAGGSADGAACLLGCNALFGAGFTLPELLAIGARLGADVPFAVMGAAYVNKELGMSEEPMAASCAVGEGTGTALTVLPPVDAHVLLAKPPIGVSTAAAYQGVDAFLEAPGTGDKDAPQGTAEPAAVPVSGVSRIHPDIDGIILALNKHDLFSALGKMGNTLELYTLKRYHEVVYTKCKIQEHVHKGAVLMSGSGPTVFLLTPDPEEARTALQALTEDTLTRILTRTVV